MNNPGYDVYHQLADVATGMLDHAAEMVKAKGLKVQTVVMEGNPKSTIAKDAPKDYGCDLIVIGKSGTNAIERFLTGSTTAYVVRESPVNVLVINDDQDVAVGGY